MKRLPLLFLFLLLVAIPAGAEFYNLSPNMGLPIPQVGIEPGPQWANDINNSLTLIDIHNHTPGYGVQVPPGGININSDLTFNSNNATALRACRFTSQSSTLSSAADNQSTYVSGVDLYYRDGNGNNVRITQSGGVAGSPGSISSLASPASASYSAGSSTFTWQSAANTAANMDFASAVLRNATANSKGLTLSPPAAMGSNISEVLPSLPAATSFMQMDTSGNMSAAVAVSAGLTGSNIASNVNLNGKAVQENSKNVVVSNTNATNSHSILRGCYTNSSGAAVVGSGEGYTMTHNSTGNNTVTFSTAFGDTAICTTSLQNNNSTACMVSANAPGTGSVQIFTWNTSGVASDCGASTYVCFICIGQRP